jgi:hypothetical protein
VQEPDGYRRPLRCKIKAARHSNTKPLTWLGFIRAARSGRVPRLEFMPAGSMIFVALIAA